MQNRVNDFFEAQSVSSLSHSGILGQKWGRRRYQNPDGTLTEEGKARYAYKNKKLKFKEREAIAKREHELEMYKEKNRLKVQTAKNGGGKEGPPLFKATKNVRNFLGAIVGISASVATMYKGTSKFIDKHRDEWATKIVKNLSKGMKQN